MVAVFSADSATPAGRPDSMVEVEASGGSGVVGEVGTVDAEGRQVDGVGVEGQQIMDGFGTE